MPTPAPVPGPLAGPLTDLSQATGGGTSTAGLYGLTADAASYGFDASNLGLPSSYATSLDGKTLLNLFIASGSGRLGDGGAVAAAIQHALYYSGAYGSSTSFIPQFGKVQKEDTAAFADSLNLLQKANTISVGPGQSTTSVSQFLTQNAAIGAGNGLGAGKVTDLRQVDNIRVPDTATLMATFDKFAQQALGHKPSLQFQRQFAAAFQAAYTSAETSNDAALYDAKLNQALGKQPAGTADTSAAANESPLTLPDKPVTLGPGFKAQLGIGEPIQRDLGSVMGGLTDSINQDAAHTNGILTGDTQVTTQALPTDASLAAEQFARNTDPQGAAAKDMANTFDNFLSILKAHFGA